MRTVQEAFRKANKADLIEQYFYEHPIKISDLDDENDMTIAKSKAIANQKLDDYVERLRNIEIKQSDDSPQDLIFYVYHRPDRYYVATPEFELVSLDDLKQKGIKAENYGCEYIEQEVTMGYHIADNSLTQYYLKDLLVCIMYEANFFGFQQEHLKVKITIRSWGILAFILRRKNK